jgi:hypothetical protein
MSTSLVSAGNNEPVELLIMKNIPRDALMACEDAYHSGDERGRKHASVFQTGHRPSASGQVKHFFCNETFYEALEVHGANPSPIKGTRLVIGKLGIFNIVRLNVPGHKWVNLKRSATRNRLAQLNYDIERRFVQGNLFDGPDGEAAQGTLFMLGVMDGVDENGLAQLTDVMVALPAPNLKAWLYVKSLTEFVKLYDLAPAQTDTAVPKLREQPKKQTGDDQGN